MRDFGVNPKETSEELVVKQLCIPTNDHSALLKVWSKDTFLSACDKAGADYRKSWDKEKLFHVLQEKAPHLILEAVERERLMMINPLFSRELSELTMHSQQLENAFKLLCFV